MHSHSNSSLDTLFYSICELVCRLCETLHFKWSVTIVFGCVLKLCKHRFDETERKIHYLSHDEYNLTMFVNH